MQISLTDANGTYSIFLERSFDHMEEYIELLVKPILRAASFSDVVIDKYFVKEEDFYWDNMPLFEEKPVAKKAVAKKAEDYSWVKATPIYGPMAKKAV